MMMNMMIIRKREEHALVSPGEETRWLPALLLPEVSLIFFGFLVVLILLMCYLRQELFTYPLFSFHNSVTTIPLNHC